MNELIEDEIKQVNEQVFEIKSSDDVNRATLILKGIKGLKEKIESTFNPIIEKAHQTHKEALGKRDLYLKPVQDIEKKIKNNILVYTNKVIAEQRERERIANEALAKVAEEQKQNLLAKAKESTNKWESETLKEKAQEIKPITVYVQERVVESDGLGFRKNWKARIIDFDLIPREYLIANEALLNKEAKRSEKESHIPGVEFYNDMNVNVRS